MATMCSFALWSSLTAAAQPASLLSSVVETDYRAALTQLSFPRQRVQGTSFVVAHGGLSRSKATPHTRASSVNCIVKETERQSIEDEQMVSERPASLLRDVDNIQWDNPSTSSMRAWVETMIQYAQVDFDEKLLDEQDRIMGTLQVGVVGVRRSACWVCFGGGARPRRPRAWKTKNRRGSFGKSRKLVELLSQLPSSKEEVYGALDTWVAWELEFPIIAIKKALQFLATEQQWKRVIQVSKWMLSKGQGKTMGTYTLLLQALDYEGRVEEADAVWEKILTENEETTPRFMFTVVMAMFERHNQLKRLVQVFADMEELEVRPDTVTVERVARTYRALGLMKRAEIIEAKYPPTKWIYRYRKGLPYRIRVQDEGSEPEVSTESQIEEDVEALASDTEDFLDEYELEWEKPYFHDSETSAPHR